MGLVLVTAILIVFLGDIPVSCRCIHHSVLATLCVLVDGAYRPIRQPDSIGAIDFGILVDAAVIVLENIYRRFQAATSNASTLDLVAEATAEAVRPVIFSVLVIVFALIPLFTMQGVPGKIFAPMSETYVFALAGALLFAVLLAPVLASFMRPEKVRAHHTILVTWLGKQYASALKWTMSRLKSTVAIAGTALLIRSSSPDSSAASSCPNSKKGTSGYVPRCLKTSLTKLPRKWRTISAKSYLDIPS